MLRDPEPLIEQDVVNRALACHAGATLPPLPPAGLLERLCCRCFLRHEESRDLIFQGARIRGSQLFFQHLRLRKDGGLDMAYDAARLFSRARVYRVLALALFVIFNFACVSYNLVSLLMVRDPQSVYPVVVEPNLASTRLWFVRCQLMFAVYETSVMVYMAMFSVFWWVKYNTCTSEEDMNRYRIWHMLHRVCHALVPTMTNFSAMKTVQYLNPQVLGADWWIAMTEVEHGHTYACVVCTFVVQHVLFGITGFTAFVLKFSTLVAHVNALNNDGTVYDMAAELLLLIGFLNQTCGITQISRVEERRLFLFVFGGENSCMEAGELDRQEVYLASCARHICRMLYANEPPIRRRFKRAVALMSFDHRDIQSLILQEDERKEVDAERLRRGEYQP